MDIKTYLQEIESWLKERLALTNMDGYVLGVSGGIDSAVVARIAQLAVGDKLLAVILPCESDEADKEDAIELLEKFHIPYLTIDLTSSYQHLIAAIETEAKAKNTTIDKLAHMNTKVRLRMVTLYALAQSRRSLVLGTDNWDEYYTGYFTKYGDGAVDLLPIVHLTKGEVFQAAKILEITPKIINRIPSAGLYVNQTDEKEMGVSYEDLDNYLLGKEIKKEAVARILHLHNVSRHKRDPIASPKPFLRD